MRGGKRRFRGLFLDSGGLRAFFSRAFVGFLVVYRKPRVTPGLEGPLKGIRAGGLIVWVPDDRPCALRITLWPFFGSVYKIQILRVYQKF